MHFDFVDRTIELTDERIVTLKSVTSAEEYLRDHFPSFPVLPGVFMLESMVQAGRALLTNRDPENARHVLGEVRALKYGTFVKPGDTMRITVTFQKSVGEASYQLRGGAEIAVSGGETNNPAPSCVSGRFTMRPLSAAVPR